MYLKHTKLSGVATAIATLLAVGAAQAQEEAEKEKTGAKSSFLEEIVVTAQKREQSIQDVGIAVTAFTGDQLEAASFENVTDVLAQVPNAVARRHYPSRGLTTNLFIRGIGQTDFNNGTESSVAPFIDDFYLIQASQADFATYDMERVEVLRGPQGTIFGRNATGGAVQSITRRPGEEFGGKVEVGFGNFGTQVVEGRINIPLSDKVQFRASGISDKHDHFVQNILEGQTPSASDELDQDFRAGRLQLRILPSETVDINLKVETAEVTGDLTSDQGTPFAGTPDGDVVAIPVNGSGFDPVALGVDGPDLVASDSFTGGANKIDHALARVDWEAENFTLTSITGVLDQTFEVIEDCDGSPDPTCAYWPLVESKHWSQELRLNGQAGRVNWTAGVYYLEQEAQSHMLLPLFLDSSDISAPTAGLVDVRWNLDVKSLAAFGQIEYELNEKWAVTAGLRVNRDEKEFEQERDFATLQFPAGTTTWTSRDLLRPYSGIGNTVITAPGVSEVSRSVDHRFTREAFGDLTEQADTSLSGNVQVDYRPQDNLLVYAAFRRGLKAAGFNNGLVSITQDQAAELFPYGEEVLHAYELGWKWDFEGNLPGRLNGAVFYYDYQDFQATSYLGVGNIISNNDAQVSGAELEFQISPADGWFFQLGLGFLFDTNVENVGRISFTSDDVFVADRELAESSDFSWNALLRYEWSAFGGDWGAQIDASYLGERFNDALNQTDLVLPSLSTANASVSYVRDDGISVRLWARNITEERQPTNIIAAPGLDSLGHFNWNEPRTYGLTVGYEF